MRLIVKQPIALMPVRVCSQLIMATTTIMTHIIMMTMRVAWDCTPMVVPMREKPPQRSHIRAAEFDQFVG